MNINKNKHGLLSLLILTLVFFTSSVWAQDRGGFLGSANGSVPISDAGSYVLGGVVDMKWEDAVPNRNGNTSSLLRGQFQVQLQLHTKMFENKRARIYIVLEPTVFGDVVVNYTSTGMLLDGHVSNMQRGLMYVGALPSFIYETVTMDVVTNGDNMVKPEQLHFRFEAEFF